MDLRWVQQCVGVLLCISSVAYAETFTLSTSPMLASNQVETVEMGTLATEQMTERAAGRQDAQLVGNWVGDAPAQQACLGYAWRTERTADGAYRLHYFDEGQTLLDDKGYWWVDNDGYYHEYSTDTQEEAVVYSYTVSGAKVLFRNLNPYSGSTCVTAEFTEDKVGG